MPHDLESYHKRVSNFGIKCSLEHNFYSSTEVTISHLQKIGVKNIYCIGNKCLKDKLRKFFNVIDRYDENFPVEAVVAGFSTELVYDELKGACLYLQTKDIPFIATNGDWRCPIEDGLYIPDCGGLCKWIEMCTDKKPLFLGKPEPTMIYQVMEKFGVSKEETMMVGDRYYTDIVAGLNAGVDTVAVLSGETTLEEFQSANKKPTYIIDSIADLIDLIK